MVNEVKLKGNIDVIDGMLDDVGIKIREAIDLSLREAANNPSIEDEILSVWSTHALSINDYFIHQAEESGNSHIGKRIVKYMMFGKF